MWEKIKQIWRLRDLRARIGFTLALLLLSRILAHIPLPGVDYTELQKFFSSNDIFNLLDLFSGGGIKNFSLVLLSVGPYITSSIVFQLLTMVVPSLEALQKEGEYGRQKINQYTRFATVPLALIQTYTTLLILKNQNLLTNFSPLNLATMLITATAGTLLMMWLGEIITENGLGNGISLIITVGILSRLPITIENTLRLMGIDWTGGQLNFDAFDSTKAWTAAGFLLFALLGTAAIVLVTEGERQLPVTYARRARGASTAGSVNTHLPIRVTTAGVIPIIFGISLMLFPQLISRFLQQARSVQLQHFATFIDRFYQNNLAYGIVYFILVVAFTYFYTSIVFQPEQVAENLQKQGGFIPGIRPGKETVSYLNFIITRITLIGAVFLGIVAILPFLVQSATHTQTLVFGGTSLLIVVSVIIETMRQFRAQIAMRTYDF